VRTARLLEAWHDSNITTSYCWHKFSKLRYHMHINNVKLHLGSKMFKLHRSISKLYQLDDMNE